jgi:polo-like kinase 1
VVLLNYFQQYLIGDGNDVSIESEKSERKKNQSVYMTKWIRTKHALMFRLNNKIVQVDFLDKTQLILCSDTRMVSYLDKKGVKRLLSLKDALKSADDEMNRRMRYTKDLVSNICIV